MCQPVVQINHNELLHPGFIFFYVTHVSILMENRGWGSILVFFISSSSKISFLLLSSGKGSDVVVELEVAPVGWLDRKIEMDELLI